MFRLRAGPPDHGRRAAAPPRGGGLPAPVLPDRGPVRAGPRAEGGPDPAGGLHADGRAGGDDRGRAAAGRSAVHHEAAGDGGGGLSSRHALLPGQAPHQDQPHLQPAPEDAQRYVSSYFHQRGLNIFGFGLP